MVLTYHTIVEFGLPDEVLPVNVTVSPATRLVGHEDSAVLVGQTDLWRIWNCYRIKILINHILHISHNSSGFWEPLTQLRSILQLNRMSRILFLIQVNC